MDAGKDVVWWWQIRRNVMGTVSLDAMRGEALMLQMECSAASE